MNESHLGQRRPRTAQALLLLASLVVVTAGLKAAQGFLVPVLLAFFVATVSFPITAWLRQRRVPRAIAVMLTVLVDFAFLTGLVFLVISAVGDLQTKWNTEYSNLSIQKLKSVVATVSDSEARMRDWWNSSMGGPLSPEELEKAPKAKPVPESEIPDATDESSVRPEDTGVSQAAEVIIGQLQELQFSQVWNLGTGLLGSVVSFLGTSLVVIILTVFMLTEARMFGRRMEAVCEAKGPNIQRMLSAVKDTQRYLGIKTAISLATGLLAALLCWAANLDFWPLWGIVAFALNFIPVVGSIIAAVPAVLLALLVSGPTQGIVIASGYFVINTFLGNFLEPMLMGRRFGLSTLVVLISVMFWGWLWGPVGALLAVPLTMMVKVILDNSEEFRWIAVAIGSESKPPKEEARIIAEGAAERTEDEVEVPEAGLSGRS
ncbi:MAG: AI-2E family transporter [Akkermansiaceae bacterium]|jgi:AI-2 transport protein TqsA|nr:AI-2E family transporter [Akkermansiaceae bacterium]